MDVLVVLILKGGIVHSTNVNNDYPLLLIVIPNVWYTSLSAGCAIQCVGFTTSRLRDRLHDHLYDIEKNHSNVAKHFNECHAGDLSALHIQGVEKVVVSKRGGRQVQITMEKGSVLDL